MNFLDKMFLVGTAMVSVFALWSIGNRVSNSESRHHSDYYHGIALAVLGVASLLLTFLGWGILGIMGEGTSNKLVAIVSSLIPFAWATGLVSRFYPKYEKVFMGTIILGLVLITASRFMDAALLSRIVYPVFHSTAGIVVIATPILAYKRQLVNVNFLMVSIGGTLISAAGISMAFLSGGKQLLFFSKEFVLMIMAPLLFVTILLYAVGMLRGEKR